MNRLGSFLLNPFVIGLFVSLVIIFFLPPVFQKYVSKHIHTDYEYESQVYYRDLDNDSYSEKIWLHYDGNNSPSDKAYAAPAVQVDTCCSARKSNKVLDQFNFTKAWSLRERIFFGDLDNDGFQEMYFFGFKDDSLFLLGLDPFKRKGFFMDKYLATYHYYNKMPDLLFSSDILLCDLNNDGTKEILGSVRGAYSALPRFIYAFDFKNDTLYKSKTACMDLGIKNIKPHPEYKHIIAFSNSAPGNASRDETGDTLYSDYSSWFVLLDNQLEMIFPPIENAGFTSSVVSFLQQEKSGLYAYALFKQPKGNNLVYLRKYNLDGEKVSELEIAENNWIALRRIKSNNDYKLYLVKNKNVFYLINEKTELKKVAGLKLKNSTFFDLDCDGSEEIFNWETGQDVAYIYRNNFEDPCSVKIQDMTQTPLISTTRFRDGSSDFMIHSNDYTYYYTYRLNKLYYLKYPLYILIYLIVSLLFYILFYFQKKSIQKKYEAEKKMTELELLTIKNQMDPHFTFNVINTASYMVYNKDKKTAYRFLVNFSNLIRNVLQKSKEIAVPLHYEIEFVKNYLVLQQVRHDFKFEYQVILKGNIDQDTLVPKMIIQTFTENAIKHGLANKKSKGKLDIIISKENGNIKIIIEDNGVGREEAKNIAASQKISTGKGHDIINQIITLFNKLRKTSVTYTITDLYSGNTAAGTRVEIFIPIKQDQNE